MSMYDEARGELHRLELLGRARAIEDQLSALQQEISMIPDDCTDEAYTAAVKSVQMFIIQQERQQQELQDAGLSLDP